MTLDFNPERYLHEALELAIAEPEFARTRTRRRWGSAVFETAAALVAAGCLSAELAREVVSDYETRARHPFWGGHVEPSRRLAVEQRAMTAGESLTAPRVVTVERDLVRPGGSLRVHYVTLGDTSTSAVITTIGSSTLTDQTRRGGHLSGRGPRLPRVHEWLTLTDDQGNSEQLEIWGGPLQRLATKGPLSTSTKWISFGPDRVDLAEPVMADGGHVETLPSVDPVVDHLWRRVATYFCFCPLPGPLPLIDVSIDALFAAGALQADSPVINQVRAVTLAFTGHPVATNELPSPWASLLSGWSRKDSPTGAIGCRVAVPRIGDASISMEGLVSRGSDFRLYLTASPAWQLTGAPFVGLEAVTPLSWWAEDDLGNHYLGCVGDGGRKTFSDRAEGSVRFWPGLDQQATELRILPATAAQRAVCSVALPRWRAAGP